MKLPKLAGGTKKLLMILVLLVFGFVTFSWLALNGFNRRNSGHMQWGASFSVKYAQELGMDWREAYQAIVTDLPLKRIRLMSYWDQLEPEPGHYSFDDLDWQVQQAADRGIQVTLAVGLRQPRYPECHYPAWFTTQNNREQAQQAALGLVEQVIKRYRDNPTVVSWQPENEALNKGFGLCRWINRAWLKQEYRLIKSLSSKPIVSNLSDEVGLPLSGPLGEKVGFSVYKKYWESKVLHRYITYPLPPWFHRWRAAMIQRYWGKEVTIHELQMEPWGPKATHLLSTEEQSQTMDAVKMSSMADFARKTGIKQVDLWGAEWWYWRKAAGDDSLWRQAQEILSSQAL